MAKGKLKVSDNWSNFNNTLNKKLEETTKQVKEIAYESEIIAQQTIIIGSSLPNFTQKHEMELANYITTEKTNNGYRIVAGEGAPPEILYELYYAEYGAGVDKIESPIYNIHIPHGRTRYFPNKPDYWVYPLLSSNITITPVRQNQGFSNYGVTNTSIPLEYMKTARNYARERLTNLKINTKKKITTSIKRGVKNAIEK